MPLPRCANLVLWRKFIAHRGAYSVGIHHPRLTSGVTKMSSLRDYDAAGRRLAWLGRNGMTLFIAAGRRLAWLGGNGMTLIIVAGL